MIESRALPDATLRILHVLRAPQGGLFRHVVDLTREQVARGHHVGLLVDSLTGGDRAEQVIADLSPSLALGVTRIPMPRRPHPADAINAIKVEARARRLQVDVLHGHGSKGGVYARSFGLLPRSRGPVRCYTPHGGSFNRVASPPAQALSMGVERLLAARTDVVLFESVYIANRFHQRLGDTGTLMRIVQNGIGPDDFEPVTADADAADLLYVGELSSARGLNTLIDALAVLQRRLGRPVTLNLVGSGPDRTIIEQRAKARGVADVIRFLGLLPARCAFARGRLLVVPSRAESLPYIVLEAAGAHMPMVATDVGGIGEIFGPYRDRLVASNDPTALARAIESAMESDPHTIGQQTRDLAAFVAARFSVEIMAGSVIAAYQEAISRRTPSLFSVERVVPALS